jgi:hypothetical protein
MIFAKGKLYEAKDLDRVLSGMEEEINLTLASKVLPVETVIAAIDRLSRLIAGGAFNERLSTLSIDGLDQYMEMAVFLLSRENLENKIQRELGVNAFDSYTTNPPDGQQSINVKRMPLGTLLHIAAGNVDGLPAFSLAEGLLTGNVNIIKLPQADDGLSLEIIQKVIEIEPELADFIYVFDTPSTDVMTIKKLADMADGIIVWGGELAVTAVRQFAPNGAKLIEWGHKLGFAYVSGFEKKQEELAALAEHIITTKQLLCSSCQTIFIDSEDMEEVHAFCRDFLPHLEAAVQRHPSTTVDGIAEITLLQYNEKLEKILTGKQLLAVGEYKGYGCSLLACEDKELELSNMFGNCLVKRLPQKELFTYLRKQKGKLQTAGLICTLEKRAALTDQLARCGVVRVTRAGDMSAVFFGEAHDGEYPLLRYTRILNIE